MIESQTTTLITFGKGDILVSAGVDYGKITPMITLTNRIAEKIADYDLSIIKEDENGMPRVDEFQVKMIFHRPESIDVMIKKLQESKRMFEIPESERVNEISKEYQSIKSATN